MDHIDGKRDILLHIVELIDCTLALHNLSATSRSFRALLSSAHAAPSWRASALSAPVCCSDSKVIITAEDALRCASLRATPLALGQPPTNASR